MTVMVLGNSSTGTVLCAGPLAVSVSEAFRLPSATLLSIVETVTQALVVPIPKPSEVELN